MSVLEITLKRRSSTSEISAFDALYDCQGYSDLPCYFQGRKSFHSPNMGEQSTYLLDDTTAIGLPLLGGQEKYDIIVSM